MVDITDPDEFADWLQHVDRELALAFGCRSALRTLPDTLSERNLRAERLNGATFLLACLRVALNTCVLSAYRGPEKLNKRIHEGALKSNEDLKNLIIVDDDFREAATHSIYAARSLSDALDAHTIKNERNKHLRDAVYGSQSVLYGRVTDDVEEQYASDVAFVSAGSGAAKDFLRQPLWSSDPIQEIAQHFYSFEAEAPGTVWAFWAEWYRGMLEGKPLDWELQRRVALIPDEDWDQGPERVAQAIGRIRLLYRTEVAPQLIFDEDQKVFRPDHEDRMAPDLLDFACERIATVLQNALDASGDNGLREDSYETITIRRALEQHSGRATLLAPGFFDACISLQRNVGDRYPNDTSLINLQNALYAVVEEINETHSDARLKCARLATLAQPKPITRQDKDALSEVPNEIKGQLDTEAQGILESDVESILTDPDPPKSVRARLTNWVTTVSGWLDKATKYEKKAKWLAGIVGRFVRWWSGEDETEQDKE